MKNIANQIAFSLIIHACIKENFKINEEYIREKYERYLSPEAPLNAWLVGIHPLMFRNIVRKLISLNYKFTQEEKEHICAKMPIPFNEINYDDL